MAAIVHSYLPTLNTEMILIYHNSSNYCYDAVSFQCFMGRAGKYVAEALRAIIAVSYSSS